jgi:hypothetical protein
LDVVIHKDKLASERERVKACPVMDHGEQVELSCDYGSLVALRFHRAYECPYGIGHRRRKRYAHSRSRSSSTAHQVPKKPFAMKCVIVAAKACPR